MVDAAEIEQCMVAGDEQAAGRLFEAAMVAGGADNISIVLASAFSGKVGTGFPSENATNVK
jgi:hypothetical protein